MNETKQSMKHKQEHGREGKQTLFLTTGSCHKVPQISRAKEDSFLKPTRRTGWIGTKLQVSANEGTNL
jgi:hypothetical protein